MNYQVESFSDGVRHWLEATIGLRSVTVAYDGTTIYSSSLDSFLELISNYNTDDLVNGPPYYERKLFAIFNATKENDVLSAVLRTFAVSCRFISFDHMKFSTSEEAANQNINENCKQVLFDFTMIEWTGGLGAQPTMYYVKKERIASNKSGLEALHHIGLLQKCVALTNIEFTSYCMPFDPPEKTRIQILPHLILWNSIVRDRNERINRFVQGQGL